MISRNTPSIALSVGISTAVTALSDTQYRLAELYTTAISRALHYIIKQTSIAQYNMK